MRVHAPVTPVAHVAPVFRRLAQVGAGQDVVDRAVDCLAVPVGARQVAHREERHPRERRNRRAIAVGSRIGAVLPLRAREVLEPIGDRALRRIGRPLRSRDCRRAPHAAAIAAESGRDGAEAAFTPARRHENARDQRADRKRGDRADAPAEERTAARRADEPVGEAR